MESLVGSFKKFKVSVFCLAVSVVHCIIRIFCNKNIAAWLPYYIKIKQDDLFLLINYES